MMTTWQRGLCSSDICEVSRNLLPNLLLCNQVGTTTGGWSSRGCFPLPFCIDLSYAVSFHLM